MIWNKNDYLAYNKYSINIYERQFIRFLLLLINYHKFDSLKQHPFIMSQFCIWKLSLACLGLCSQYHKAKVIMLASLSSHPEALRKNLFPSSFWLLAEFSSLQFKTEVPIFLLAVRRICSQLLEAAGITRCGGLSIFKASNRDSPSHWILFMLWISLSSSTSDLQTHILKVHMIRSGPPTWSP